MLYLLDTCVISDFVKGVGDTIYKVKMISPADLAISAITLYEIEYGFCKSPEVAVKLRDIVDKFISTIQVLNFDRVAATHAAVIRADLALKGTLIGAYDILIAGIALANNLTLVTSNSNEFTRINNLRVENWRHIS